jgi:hypothetical protein
MAQYAVESLNTRTGTREELPYRFSTREEALAKQTELMSAQPGQVFIVKIVPAA